MAAVPPEIPGLADWRALARGGFAIVWVARQESLNRLVAVKVDQRTLDSDSEQRRFLREAGAAGRMSGHPGIVTVHDAGILTDDRPYLVMELCEGGSLTKWVKAEERPGAAQVREVGVRIADALAATHARGVLHRDVKPANILIDSYGHAGLADFGLAALPDPGMELSETLEAITPAYAPPEVFQRKPPTEFGDVFSLGATLYALLAGRPPRWPETGTPNIADMLERQEEPIERIPGLHDGLMDVLLAAMATGPADRPSAAQFRDLLTELDLDPPPPQARRVASASAAAAPVAAAAAATTASEAEKKGEPADGVAASSAAPVPVPVPVPTETKTEPEKTSTPDGSDRPTDTRRRRRGWILVVAAAIVAAVVVVSLVNLLPGPVAGVPPVASPTSSPTPAGSPSIEETPTPTRTRTPTPQPAEVPASFRDCSEQLGPDTYCTPVPECWGSVNNVYDAPLVGLEAGCNGNHVYQTFAVGMLDFVPRRQSSLEAVPQVKKVCRQKVVNTMLVDEDDQRSDWEVIALAPQTEDEAYYRCIFGRGERSLPFKLAPPS